VVIITQSILVFLFGFIFVLWQEIYNLEHHKLHLLRAILSSGQN